MEDVPGHIRQTEVAAGVTIRQALGVEPEEMEDRRVVVVARPETSSRQEPCLHEECVVCILRQCNVS